MEHRGTTSALTLVPWKPYLAKTVFYGLFSSTTAITQ
jgi:hypothetical protein